MLNLKSACQNLVFGAHFSVAASLKPLLEPAVFLAALLFAHACAQTFLKANETGRTKKCMKRIGWFAHPTLDCTNNSGHGQMIQKFKQQTYDHPISAISHPSKAPKPVSKKQTVGWWNPPRGLHGSTRVLSTQNWPLKKKIGEPPANLRFNPTTKIGNPKLEKVGGEFTGTNMVPRIKPRLGASGPLK